MSVVSSDCEFEKIETVGHERLVSATSLSENNVGEGIDIGVDKLDFNESNRKPDRPTDKNSECDIENEVETSDLFFDKTEVKSGTGTCDKGKKGSDLDSNDNSNTDTDKKTEPSTSNLDVTNDYNEDLNNDLNVNYDKKDTEAVTSDLDVANDVIKDSSNDNKDTEAEYFSDESESGDEYESAEEGEDIQTDSTNLKELEETLTEEEKEERRNASREMKEEGNQLFKAGSYKSAIRLYSRGLRTCPLKYEKDRSVLYANRGACKVKLEEFEAAIRDCSKALDLNPDYMKVLQRRAELYENADKLDEALVDYQKILELDPGQHKARAACMKLPEMIKERNEKLKEEMMGKLKDLGNLVLRPFGLSANNFKMQQDPNTGGYSVNFVQNPDNGS